MKKRAKEEGILPKVDKKGLMIMWNEILLTLFSKMGFGERWRKWMSACFHEASYSILINGFPCASILVSRGLRWGDPLSPFTFTLLTKGVNKLIFRARALGLICELEVGPKDPIV